MESIPTNTIFKYHPDTLEFLRKQYNLDKPGRIEEAIDILENWLQKQDHFMRKEFPRDYLERTLIISKGSVERAKAKLDSICTFRTMNPEFFGSYDINNYRMLNDIHGGFLPKLTKDHYRAYVLKCMLQRLGTMEFIEYYRYFFMQCEYIQAHDYCNGIVVILDFSEANVMEVVKALNPTNLRDSFRVVREGYGMRIKGIHFLSGSKAIDAIMAIFKQVVSAKLAGRMHIHKSYETISEYIENDILPVDYGGKEKPVIELHNQFRDVLTSKQFMGYLNEMNKACTNERLRHTDNPYLEHMSVAGTFRSLNVD